MKIRLIRFLPVVLLAVGDIAFAAELQGPAIKIDTVCQTDGVHPGTTVRAAVAVNLGEGWHVNAHKPSDPYLIPTSLKLKAPEGQAIAIRETVYPEPASLALEGTTEQLAVYSHSFVIGLMVEVGGSVKPGDYPLQGALEYQACDNKRCLPPNTVPVTVPIKVVAASQPLVTQNSDVFAKIRFGQTEASAAPESAATPGPSVGNAGPLPAGDWKELAAKFKTTGTTSGYLKPSEFMAFLDGVESGHAQHGSNPLAGKGLLLVMALVLVGGVLLNLTPCVLPLIPINLAIIGAGAKAGSKKRGFLLGAAYGGGIALAYGLLGVVVVLGIASAFGTLNSTPWFNAGIAVLFLLLGLAMFDVFVIDFTRFQTKFGVGNRAGGSFLVALAMGIVAALLAGACVAPVVIATILYAQDLYAKGHWAALLLPFLLGVGMALPWPIAGAGLSLLPKPGKWMERVKYAMGAFIIAFAVYYGFLAWTLFSNQYLVNKEAVQASAEKMDSEGWISSLSGGLAQAQREGKPVFIDFWATWCKNCMVMNETTFRNKDVIDRLAKYVKIKVQAENLQDPATQEIMKFYGVVGLPTYVTLAPAGKE